MDEWPTLKPNETETAQKSMIKAGAQIDTPIKRGLKKALLNVRTSYCNTFITVNFLIVSNSSLVVS